MQGRAARTEGRASRNPWGLLAAGSAFLLPVAYSPSVYATFWSPKAAVLLIAGAFGLARLSVLLRSPLRAVTIAAIAFLGVATLSTLVARDRAGAVFGTFNWGTGLVFVACLVGVWALGASVGDEAPLVRRCLLAGIAVSCAVAFIQAFVDLGLPALEATSRAAGLAGNPVHLGALAALGVALCAGAPGRPALAGVLAFTASAQLSGTRLAVLVAVVAAVVLGLRAAGWRRAATLAVVALLGLALGTVVADAAGFETATGRTDDRAFDAAQGGGVRVRLELWSYARHAVFERPVLGHGPGRFRAATLADRTLPVVRAEGPEALYADAHNLLVEYAVTTGILGVLALAWWLFSALRVARGPFAAGALVLLAISLGQPQSVGTTPLLFLALGVGAAHLVDARARTPRPALAFGVAGVLAAALLLAGDAALLRLRNDFDLRDGRRADALLHPWPKPATIVARAHTFAAIDADDPARRRAERAEVRRWDRIAVDRDPTDPGLWFALADDERVDGRFDDATRHYREALRHDPYAVNALIGLGRVAVAEHRNDDAARWFRQALAIRPNRQVERLLAGLA